MNEVGENLRVVLDKYQSEKLNRDALLAIKNAFERQGMRTEKACEELKKHLFELNAISD